ncbi:hypothetical protein CTheo_7747 [Ceratobasidium theobromae]|uniref:Uncharacterized protein n=1 Tax=Ceratobasidium theobromae TaxID=1582974 RepID=A0A5N5QAP2_9AGAM|nr:hypothetical protein CTheo_7747 [Ceratobasidium theobromae]
MGRRTNFVATSICTPANRAAPHTFAFKWDARFIVPTLARVLFVLPLGFVSRVHLRIIVECQLCVEPLPAAPPHIATDEGVIVPEDDQPPEMPNDQDEDEVLVVAQVEPRAVHPLLGSLHGVLG